MPAETSPDIDLTPLQGGARIDVQHHVILPEYERALVRAGMVEDSWRVSRTTSPAATGATIAELGIAAPVMLPFSTAGIHHGKDEAARYLCRATNEAAARFRDALDLAGFMAILPSPDVDGALAEMDYALDVLGADGVAFLTEQGGVYLGDPRLEPLYQEMHRRKIVAYVHPARPPYAKTLALDLWVALIEYTFETTRAAVNLIHNGVMARFPGIAWILAHGGGTLPFLSARLAMLEDHGEVSGFMVRHPEGSAPYLGRFYFDVALAGDRPAMAALAAIADPGKILYGSDWPYVSKGALARQIVNLRSMPEFAGERLAAMEHGNARLLFPRLAQRAASRAGSAA
jgi:predicted TIM-barrel fold metal-dependent hydrolase